jgi:hypothetical protein
MFSCTIQTRTHIRNKCLSQCKNIGVVVFYILLGLVSAVSLICILFAFHRFITVIIKPFFTQKIGPFFTEKVGPFFTEKIGPFFTEKIGPFFTEKVGPFFTEKVGPFFTEKIGPFLAKLVDRFQHVFNLFLSLLKKLFQ